MNEQWAALAAQIRALKVGLAAAERRAAEAHNTAAQALQQVAELTRERDQYKALCDLHDAQQRAGIVTMAPPDDTIVINLKDLKK